MKRRSRFTPQTHPDTDTHTRDTRDRDSDKDRDRDKDRDTDTDTDRNRDRKWNQKKRKDFIPHPKKNSQDSHGADTKMCSVLSRDKVNLHVSKSFALHWI